MHRLADETETVRENKFNYILFSGCRGTPRGDQCILVPNASFERRKHTSKNLVSILLIDEHCIFTEQTSVYTQWANAWAYHVMCLNEGPWFSYSNSVNWVPSRFVFTVSGSDEERDVIISGKSWSRGEVSGGPLLYQLGCFPVCLVPLQQASCYPHYSVLILTHVCICFPLVTLSLLCIWFWRETWLPWFLVLPIETLLLIHSFVRFWQSGNIYMHIYNHEDRHVCITEAKRML